MTELFPQLRGLNGGKKQLWLNSNLPLIAALSDVMEFDRLCEVLYCKPDTLANALRKAESRHRPMITRADKAENLAIKAHSLAFDTMRELEAQAEVLSNHITDTSRKFEALARFHEAIGNANIILAELLKQGNMTSNFTEHT